MALDHISALAGPMGEDAELRPARVEDLAFQGDHLRRQAHALWAAVEDTQVVVARTAQRRAEMADEEASVESAELTVRLPGGKTVTARLAPAGAADRHPGWITWKNETTTGTADSIEQLELEATLHTLATLLGPHLYDAEDDCDPTPPDSPHFATFR
ncbi:hypothetical protein ABT009_41955 [Streptomyces sp. NPDC002896]|uniref:hypothetical protein n=1 Tax=Streptomyces sp. NPDC002896 TaxID=3154438 RepID=UPI003330636C